MVDACRCHVLPVIILISLPIICFTTYGIAVSLGHVSAAFPYISDTGTKSPESCVFGLLLGMYAFMSSICIYIRYEHVRVISLTVERKPLKCTNIASLIIGMISVVGLYLVANFQETNVLVIHMLGAFLAFVGINIYFWIQTVLSYRGMEIPGRRPWINHFRLIITLVHLTSFISVIGAAILSSQQTNGNSGRLKWRSTDVGFSAHTASAAMEWILAMASGVYFCTFAAEFSRFRVTWPRVLYSPTDDMHSIVQINSTKLEGITNKVMPSGINDEP